MSEAIISQAENGKDLARKSAYSHYLLQPLEGLPVAYPVFSETDCPYVQGHLVESLGQREGLECCLVEALPVPPRGVC